jgi:hypothetical protein
MYYTAVANTADEIKKFTSLLNYLWMSKLLAPGPKHRQLELETFKDSFWR